MEERKKLLIADDEELICALLRHIIRFDALNLALAGEVHDGTALLRAIETEKPDIVVTDISMPGMDALEVIRRTRGLGLATAFVLVSGHREFEYAYGALKYGVEDYLLKPIDEEELDRTLQKALRRLRGGEEPAAKAEEETAPQLSKTVRLACAYVRESYTGTVTLESAAAVVHLNAAYFSKLFKRETGKNFSEYVAEVRLDHAKELLSRGRMNISEVAFAVGFSDVQYFSKTFKRCTGMRPSEYRERFG